MDRDMTSVLFYGGLFLYGLVLFALKRRYLEKLENTTVSYILGLTAAYIILAGIFFASWEIDVVGNILREAVWSGRTHTFPGAGFLLAGVPAVYSVFLLGFFEKDGKEVQWKEKVKMMASVWLNLTISILGLLCLDYMWSGHSMGEVLMTLIEGFCSIGWESGLLSLIGLYIIFRIIKHDHFKRHNR